MRGLEKCHDVPLSEDLAQAISTMTTEDDYFALLLSHEYTTKSIQSLGVGALKGIDAARFHALEEANEFVGGDKKLKFFIAELKHKIDFGQDSREGWCPEQIKQSIHWYSTNGEELGAVKKVETSINFLNPGQETLSKLWVPHGVSQEEGYMGNEGPTKSTRYARYGIFAWPDARHAELSLRLTPVTVAAEAVYLTKPVNAADLRKFLDGVDARLDAEKKYSRRADLPIKFCRLFCELATDADDPALIKLFFTNFCPPLGCFDDNESFVPALTRMLQVFQWSDIGEELLSKVGLAFDTYNMEEEKIGLSCMDLGLRVLNGLDSGPVQDSLLKMVMKEATSLSTEKLGLSKAAGLLLKWVNGIENSDENADIVANKFGKINPSLLGPTIEKFLQDVSHEDETYKKNDTFQNLVSKRIKWLNKQIEKVNKPFSWEMPRATFSDNATVQTFLRGPEVTMKMSKGVRKFKSFHDANNYAAKWTRKKQVNASFKMEASSINADAVVTITKTRKWFAKCQEKLQQYQEELARLKKFCGDEVEAGGKKRPRLE